MKSVLITHDSLDGATCGMLAKEAWQDEVDIYVYSDFGVANSEVIVCLERLLDVPTLEYLIIASLPINERVAKWIEEHWSKTVVAINHHQVGFNAPTAEWLQEDFLSNSAAVLYTEMLLRELVRKNNGRLISFLDLAAIFETRDSSNPLYGTSRDLNRLFYFLGIDKFIERGYEQVFSAPERYALENVQLWEQRQLRSLAKLSSVSVDVRGISYTWGVFGDDHIIEEAGDAVATKRKVAVSAGFPIAADDIYYVVLLNPVTGKAHLFSDGHVDIGSIARSLGGYGSRVRGNFNVPMAEAISAMKKLLNSKKDNG